MNTKQQQQLLKIRRTAAVYNMIPNLVWTALFLLPATIFCYTFITLPTTCILLAVSLTSIFFPNSFFDKIQWSTNARFYEKAGVRYINRFAQGGSLLNEILRRKYPEYKVVSRTRASLRKQYFQTYFFEKFHFALALFFVAITILAIAWGQLYWVLVLVISNVLYNVYPNLLQQYIRVKLKPGIIAKERR